MHVYRWFVMIVGIISLLAACASKQKKGVSAGAPKTEEIADTDDGAAAGKPGDSGTASPEVEGGHAMSKNARGIYNDAVRQAREGSLAEAEASFKRVLQIDGRAYQAAYNLGVIAERLGDDVAAKSYYKQSIDMQPNYPAAVGAYCKLEIRSGNVEDALDFAKDKAESFPKNTELLKNYSDVLIAARRFSDAIDQAKRVLRMDERDAGAMLRIGKANLRLGRNELASAILEQVLTINPDEAEAYFLRAAVRAEDGRRSLAIADLKTAVEKRPTYVEAMNNLASLYLISGNYDEAAALLSGAVAISPSWAILHLNLGNALRGARQWQASKEALEKAMSLSSEASGAVFNMALLYYTADELDNIDKLARLKEAKKLFARYKNERGSALKDSDEVFKYIKEVQVAIEREETRIARLQERDKQEAERSEARDAASEGKEGEAIDAGESSVEEEEREEGGGGAEDEGWF